MDMLIHSIWLIVCFFCRITNAYLGPLMGILSVCDDAKTNLQVDWDERDFTQFTCMEDHPWTKSDEFEPVYLMIPGLDPTTDIVWHKCMNETIFYDEWPPLRGDHRPNWAVYGEYLFLPPQRWLHNLEHGAIVFLYHPCADMNEVDRLRRILRSCLYRHIITPYNRLSPQRPLALLSWGSKLLMNKVDEMEAINFIMQHAKVAPEDLSKQGIYDYYLIRKADVVNGSDIEDSRLCPGI